MKKILIFLKDILLVIVTAALVAGSFYGVRLSYRNAFAQNGPFQIEAFKVGLAIFEYRVAPAHYHLVSPLNDFTVDGEGIRSALVSQETYNSKNFKPIDSTEKPQALLDSIKTYFGLEKPWYKVTTPDVTAEYQSEVSGSNLVIKRRLTFKDIQNLEEQGMTLQYNAGEIVSDITSGSVEVTDPMRSGMLVVRASSNQQLTVNSQYGLIELTQPVTSQTKILDMQIVIEAKQ